MIAMPAVHSTGSRIGGSFLWIPTLLWLLLLSGCVSVSADPGPAVMPPVQTSDAFVMPDGLRLPYRSWLPDGEPWAVVLALHGMNDSRDAWEIPAPQFTAAGIAVFSPDQRGFGDTSVRGYWPGGDGLAADAAEMARLLRLRYPEARLILMGESMGAAVLMRMATGPNPPKVDGYVLIAPAVWGRSAMNPALRTALWVTSRLFPGMKLTGPGIKVTASDNIAALRRLSSDPLTLRATRVDSVRGLVDLMDDAQDAAASFDVPALVLYGGKDELIPPRATRLIWERMPALVHRGYYPDGYHLLLRDLGREEQIGDVVAWMRDPKAKLPSGADARAAAWMAETR
jgi:alpha-beta hydrolase superfamily lysophospholipase